MTFTFNGHEYEYLEHSYNHTSDNMRTAEIPIARAAIEKTLSRKPRAAILEVGNVLSHYDRAPWLVLDAREKGHGIVNADVMTWEPPQKYDLIVSVSTLEHVGFGEYANLTAGPVAPLVLVERLRSWLTPYGYAVVTIPIGYNPAWDAALRYTFSGTSLYFMRRTISNEWEQCDVDAAFAALEREDKNRWGDAFAVLNIKNAHDDCEEAITVGDKKVLNIGAGNDPIVGAVNHDITKHHDYIDVVWDLNNLPWPWEDDSFDLVNARAVLEHLDRDLLTTMNEIWRILKPGGVAVIKLPFWQHEVSWEDPTHRRGYALKTFDYFDPSTKIGKKYDFYTPRKWKITRGPRLNRSGSSIHCTLQKIA